MLVPQLRDECDGSRERRRRAADSERKRRQSSALGYVAGLRRILVAKGRLLLMLATMLMLWAMLDVEMRGS